MEQWMGNLFFRKQPISEIRSLRYHEMKYWNNWHELMIKEEQESIKRMNAKGKKNA
jgi:hypothetical protein